MSGKNQFQASNQIYYRLKNVLRGSSSYKNRHINRAKRIASEIWCRWHKTPATWRLKHVRWYLSFAIKDLSKSSRYEYYLTIVQILKVQKNEHWIGYLNGPWIKPQ